MQGGLPGRVFGILGGVALSTAWAVAPALAGSEASAQNQPPVLVVHTTPAADSSTNPPTITGKAPFTVGFGLCQSSDPDPGDSLNWQFNFGDSGSPAAFNPDQTFNPDADHVCHVDHTYTQQGTYTAWVSVTDKHLEDQGRGVSSLARKSQAFTIQVQGTCAPGLSVDTGFEGPAPGTPVESLAIPGVSFDSGGTAVVLSFPPGAPPPFSGNLIEGFGGGLQMTFTDDQTAYSFAYATLPGDSLQVTGYDKTGNIVFSQMFPSGVPAGPGSPFPTASGSGTTFRSLLFIVGPAGLWAIDSLSTTAACE